MLVAIPYATEKRFGLDDKSKEEYITGMEGKSS
jgi:hypothetical protein